MPTSYTTLLGLAKPATGELSGTWGTTVNNYITDYVDSAVAGAQVISGTQTAVTLSTTNGSSLTQAGSGAAGSAQYAIIRCTGSPAGLLTITVPAADKVYLVINATSTSQSVKVVGLGPTTGVTVAASRAALIAWNGSDFALIATTDITQLSGTLAVANGGTGATTLASGQFLKGAGTSAVTTSATVALGSEVSGTLPVANGGTGTTTSTGSGSVVLAVNPTIDRATFTGNAQTTPVAVSFSATAMTVDCTESNVFTTTFTANVTVAPTISNPQDGQTINWFITQDGTGGRTMTWPSSFKWPLGTNTALSTTTNAVDLMVATYRSATGFWYATLLKAFS